MPAITFIAHDGTTTTLDVPVGTTVMRAAVDNGVGGIDGDCGGLCACATCHVFVDPAWTAAVGPQSADEASLLDLAPDPQPNSRLGCQIEITAALDGLVVRMPKSQH
jgi:2Fe-2S ferredoxin